MKIGYSELFEEEHDGGGYKSGGFIFPPLPEYHCLSQKRLQFMLV